MDIKQKTSQVNKPVIKASVNNFIDNMRLVVDCMGTFFGKNCEVVLHDLRKPESSIVAIANGHVTGRKVGGPIIGGPIDDKGLKEILKRAEHTNIVSNYLTKTRDGRTLKSTTVIFRNSKGVPVATLCLNLDLTVVNMARDFINDICATNPEEIEETSDRNDSTHNDVSTIIKEIVEEAISKIGKPIKIAEKEDKMEALRIMHDRGLFLIKGGVEYAANALGVSRFTVYNYLKELSFQ